MAVVMWDWTQWALAVFFFGATISGAIESGKPAYIVVGFVLVILGLVLHAEGLW